jgi:serine/threonine protein kinase
MARPNHTQDAVDLVRRARLVGESDLTSFLTKLSPDPGPGALFDSLVAEGFLTPYQAEELADGRWRGFWLGSYLVLDRLGKGGMGHVYLAEHAVLKKRVAVKVLSSVFCADPHARRRFVREARAATAIDHANVVHVHDVDVDHDPPYLVMEFIDGVSLQAAVALSGSFSAGEAATVGAEVAYGLRAAAAAGLVHRDIKPANILVDRRGAVKILDLGIARLPGDDTQLPGDGSEVILGTLDYLAPEQAIDSTAVDARADLYALGATLYFLLAGHPPFPGSDLRHKLAAKQYSDPPPVHRLRPDVDAGLAEVIQKLLAREPAQRYPTAADAAAALAPFAALPPNFPARLFQPKRPSTVHDEVRAHEVDPMPPTQRIVRAGLRPAMPDEPQPPYDALREGTPTAELRKAPTDPAIALVPDRELPKPSEPEPPPAAGRRVWLWRLLAGLVALAAIAIVLAAK